MHRLTQLWSSRPDTQPRIIGSSDVTADIVDQPPGDCDGRPKGRLAPVRLGIAPRRGRAAVCGQVFAVAGVACRGKAGLTLWSVLGLGLGIIVAGVFP